MGFKIGDTVIHWTYGLGEIVLIEEKVLRGQPTNCYVFRTPDLTMWIPIDDLSQSNLRIPTPAEAFGPLFTILSDRGETLPTDRMLRKDQLRAQMKDGQLASVCRVIRDLEYFKVSAKLNYQDTAILEQAIRSLLTEWVYSLGVTPVQAKQALTKLLDEKKITHVDTHSVDMRAKKSGQAGKTAL